MPKPINNAMIRLPILVLAAAGTLTAATIVPAGPPQPDFATIRLPISSSGQLGPDASVDGSAGDGVDKPVGRQPSDPWDRFAPRLLMHQPLVRPIFLIPKLQPPATGQQAGQTRLRWPRPTVPSPSGTNSSRLNAATVPSRQRPLGW